MAIIETDTITKTETRAYEGRVVKVRKYVADRNHSDTLDYTDFRSTQVTEALVYMGRHGKPYWNYIDQADRDLELHERFAWVDCTNLFTWRGSLHREPVVDEQWVLLIPGFIDDYEAWQADIAEKERVAAETKRKHEEICKAADEEAARNRPARGKRMVVCRGRKVKIGTTGTVAWISESGSCLLKNDHEWQNRQAQGVWVASQNLKARA